MLLVENSLSELAVESEEDEEVVKVAMDEDELSADVEVD